MINLLVTIAISLVSAIISKSKKNARGIDFFVIIIILSLTIFVGLRTNYNDTQAYKVHFENSDTLIEFIKDGSNFRLSENPLFYFIVSCIKSLINSYHVFFLIMSALIYSLMIKFIRKYSSNFPLSLFIFFTLGTFVFSMAALKQTLAISVLLLAIEALIEKKRIKFILIVIVASLLHTYSLLFIVLLFFDSKPWNFKTLLVLSAFIVIVFTFESTIATVLEMSESAGKKIYAYEVFDNHSVNFLRVLVYAATPIITYIFRNKIEVNRQNNILIHMSILSFCFMLLGTQSGANMFARMATYFEFGTIVIIPYVINRTFTKKSLPMIYYLLVVMFGVFFLYSNLIASSFENQFTRITIFEFLSRLMEM